MPQTAPDLSEFEELAPQKRRPCTVGQALKKLDGDDGRNFAAALDTKAIAPKAVVDWLARRNLESSTAAVTNHRSGVCACARQA